MNRIILACIALSLPSFVAAAPCNILPYANQCQGSNLWPVPDGWSADSNGDCQGEPPLYAPSTKIGWGRSLTGLGGFGTTLAESFQTVNPSTTVCSSRLTGGPTHDGREFHQLKYASESCQYWRGQYEFDPVSVCPAGYKDVRSALAGHSTMYGDLRLCGYNVMGYKESLTWTAFTSGQGVNVIGCKCMVETTPFKPSDGVCTARWTTAAETILQKDPLDPDCDVNSCVSDGTCKLR